jgi:hypothetical protein
LSFAVTVAEATSIAVMAQHAGACADAGLARSKLTRLKVIVKTADHRLDVMCFSLGCADA